MSSSTERLDSASANLPAYKEEGLTRWLALAVLLTGAFLPILDFTIVNLALPSIRQGLQATSSEVQFVISAYAATYAVMLITGGRLGDLIGRKKMFVMGVAGFTLASLLCGFATSPALLILGRILQALMASVMAPQVLASIRVLFPGREQTRALALYGATFGLANITLGCLVYPLVQGREAGWSGWMLGILFLSVVFFSFFVRAERRLSQKGLDPLVEFSLFRDRSFTVGLVMGLVFYMISAFYLTFSIYLQGGLHKTPIQAGFAVLPFAGSFFLGSIGSSHIVRRLGTYALTLGFALQVIGFGLVALAVRYELPFGLGEGLACAGVGYGIVMPGIIRAVIGNVDERHAGLASGIVMTTLQIGSALGVAIVGGVFYTVLKTQTDLSSYARAFSEATACNVALLALGGILSLLLPNEQRVAGTP